MNSNNELSLNELKSSGLLELYVVGTLDPSEQEIVERGLRQYPELNEILREIEEVQELLAFSQAVEVDPTTKPMVLACINLRERLANGVEPLLPPRLTSTSKPSDFQTWVVNDEFQEPKEYDSMYAYIIGHTESVSTMIVWLKEGAPPEVHTDELESFLILEGTCDITIGERVHSLEAGDYLTIPLHVQHHVRVTSGVRCKAILERAAA